MKEREKKIKDERRKRIKKKKEESKKVGGVPKEQKGRVN
jgi:hypothetical protein